jgi:hypothetical protein
MKDRAEEWRGAKSLGQRVSHLFARWLSVPEAKDPLGFCSGSPSVQVL